MHSRGFKTGELATVELTCATILNRIPDLIATPPGFITTEQMPTNAFRARDLINNKIVDGYVFQSGRIWKDDNGKHNKNWLLTHFKQDF